MMLVIFDVDHTFKADIPRCFYMKGFLYFQIKLAVAVLKLTDIVMELLPRWCAQKDAPFQKQLYAEVCDACSRPV